MHPIALALFVCFWMNLLKATSPSATRKPPTPSDAMNFEKYKYPEPHKFSMDGETDNA